MTAIVAILNKSAVAIAADSAVSVSTADSHKVYNSANKIFNLCIGNPIGIMIYNSAEFAGIPWETIIKLYRKQGCNEPFGKVNEYRDSFIAYLQNFKPYFTDGVEQNTISEVANNFLNILDKECEKARETEKGDTFLEMELTELMNFHRETINKFVDSYEKMVDAAPFISGFDAEDISYINTKYDSEITEKSTKQFLLGYFLNDDEQIVKRINDIIIKFTVKDLFLDSWSGLVFTGFGEDEIFPSVFSVKVGGVVNNKIRYSLDNQDIIISNENGAAIAPFAQTDIMETFVEGIDPRIKEAIPSAFESALIEFKDHILGQLDFSTEKEKNLKGLLENTIPAVVKSLVDRLDELRQVSHIDPMLSTIGTLSKEDLTEMAESLINSTYLKRRASFSEESVGRPIDVAVITKGDGFIWIKRKHYFDQALNLNYVSKAHNSNTKTI